MSLLGTWSGFIQGHPTSLSIYANQTYMFRDVIGKWEERAGKLTLASEHRTSIYNYAMNYLCGKETLTLIYDGDRIDEAIILTKDPPPLGDVLTNNTDNGSTNTNNPQYTQSFANFLQQMNTLSTIAPTSNTNIFKQANTPPPTIPVNNVNNVNFSTVQSQNTYTKVRWGITFDVPKDWFVVEKKALNSIMVASTTEPGLVMIRFMPSMNIDMFQQMYTVGFDENGVPLLPTIPLTYFPTNGENVTGAVSGEMQGIHSSPSLFCRVIGLVSAWNDCAIVCGVTNDNYAVIKVVADQVAASMKFKLRGSILYSN